MSIGTTSMLLALRQLLAGKQPGRVVWTADITYWLAGQVQAGTADPAWLTEEGFLALHRELGILPYYYYETFNAFRAIDGPEVEYRVEQQGNTTIRRYLTPLGELTEVSEYMVESACAGITKHFVESERDLDALRYLLEHRRLLPDHLGITWTGWRCGRSTMGSLPSACRTHRCLPSWWNGPASRMGTT
ncbi:MAG TPA: hypothetical protein VGM23_00235 [Armatimonadota bacterium]